MNKADLIEALAPRLGSRAAATLAVESLVDFVMREVAAGRSVGISGFGTFEPVARAARTGRNPRTGEAVPIQATTSPRFRPGAYFKDVVTDPSTLPKEGLAGARVGSDGAAPAGTGTPPSVRRSSGTSGSRRAAARPAGRTEPAARSTARTSSARPRVSGTPDTVRATRSAAPAPAAEPTRSAASGKVMSGGEEITAQMITAKKAQLARVKNDSLVKGKKPKDGGPKDAKAKDAKARGKKAKDVKDDKGKKKDKGKKGKK